MKKIILVLIALLFLDCSKDDEECFWYIAQLGDNCECLSYDYQCIFNLHVSKKEYDRLILLQNSSSEECFYVKTYSVYTGTPFEGYLLDLSSMPCPEMDGWLIHK